MTDHPRPAAESDGPERFRLLYVCTGNICRSPFAEILMRHLLIERLGSSAAAAFAVSSAGVRAVAGGKMHPQVRDQLPPRGPAHSLADRFVARQLTAGMIEHADLVLGVEPAHRSAAVQCTPAILSTAFSLREFARLAASVAQDALPSAPMARAHTLVEQANQLRGLLPPLPSDAYRVPDPIGGRVDAYRYAAALVADAVSIIVEVLAPVVGESVRGRS